VLQFNLSLNIDVAEEEVQSAINAAQSLSAVEPARAADLQQDQSRRRAGADAGDHLGSMPLSQVEDLVDTRLAPKISQLERRRPGQHQRRPEAGGAHSGQSRRRCHPTASTWKTCAPR
jgi:hypothetical protein